MKPFDTEFQRLIVPRWRSFRETASAGELASVRLTGSGELTGLDIEAKAEDWRQRRDIASATTLLEAATVSGDTAQGAEAADYLLRTDVTATAAVQFLARAVANGLPGRPSDAVGDPRALIGAAKWRLSQEPRDSLLWVDLARLYSTVGQHKPSMHAMEVALALAPNNRFVVRSAARLFIHSNDPERAHAVLTGAPATASDPWLMASEIAVASLAEHRPRSFRAGRQALSDARHSPWTLSELAGAVGTEEAGAGSLGQAKKAFRQSLIDPNDNAIAQAAWAARRYRTGTVDQTLIATKPRTFEAATWSAYFSGDFLKCYEEAERWMLDEPYSPNPAIHGSFIAVSILDEYKKGETLALAGLIANPRDRMLKNNLLVALACQGRTQEAGRLFNEIKWGDFDPYANGALGLIASRSGRLLDALDYYLEALACAIDTNDMPAWGRATFHFLKELALWSPESTRRISDLATRLLKTLTLPEFRHYDAKLRSFVDNPPPLLAHVASHGDNDVREGLVTTVLEAFEEKLADAEDPRRRRRTGRN